jgi:hypothetical protein
LREEQRKQRDNAGPGALQDSWRGLDGP